MAFKNPETPRKWIRGIPFQKFETENEALWAAKSGAWVCAFIGSSYVIQLIFIHFTGKNTFGDVGTFAMIWSCGGVILAAFLGWQIRMKQEFWAALLVALWYAGEFFEKVVAIASGQQRTNAIWIAVFIALAATAIMSLRGCWRLRQERRSAAVQS